jgi:hypothetical protein
LQRNLTAGATHRTTDFIAPETKSQVLAATPFAGPGETVDVTFTVRSGTDRLRRGGR